jgi:ABC-type uncharacterized transport system substrate-binding protein
MRVALNYLWTILFSNILFSCQHDKNLLIYVNSYHRGYAPSDEITRGIKENLPADSFDLKIIYLDSKRQTDDYKLAKGIDSTREIINNYNPRVLIVSDDYAVKYLVKPFYNKTKLPVVFCGVNWDATQYGLSPSNITGMLEVLPLRESIDFLKRYYSSAKSIAIVSENSLSEQSNVKILDTLYRNIGLEPTYFLVDNFVDWEISFVKANNCADMIYLPTNGAIKGWNASGAQKFIEENIKKPVFTCDDFMMVYCVFGFTKVPVEQGEWAAKAAKQIIKGISPSQIPVLKNKQTIKWFNSKMASIINFKPDDAWLMSSRNINTTLPE